MAKGYASDRDDEAQSLADEEIERQEEEQVAAAAEAAQEEEDLERTSRRLLVQDLEKSVTQDAQSTSEESFSIIEGPILGTQCDPEGGVIDVTARTQSLDCLAITEYLPGGQIEGYRYSATVDYGDFSYRWRLAD